MRRFAIGDIHGCAKALRTVIEAIDPQPDDELVFLGDYIDRGPNSRDAVEQIIQLQSRCNVVGLRGNHELMMLAIINRGLDEAVWLSSGGRATISSYGGSLDKVPQSHLQFFRGLLPFHEVDQAIFVHAGYNPRLSLDQHDDATLYWTHLTGIVPPPHISGKRVFVGHTPQPQGRILDHGHLVCIDTYCFGGGYLTAYELGTDEVIQADHHGHLRRHTGATVAKQLGRAGGRIWQSLRRSIGRPPTGPIGKTTTSGSAESGAAESGSGGDDAGIDDAGIDDAGGGDRMLTAHVRNLGADG